MDRFGLLHFKKYGCCLHSLTEVSADLVDKFGKLKCGGMIGSKSELFISYFYYAFINF